MSKHVASGSTRVVATPARPKAAGAGADWTRRHRAILGLIVAYAAITQTLAQIDGWRRNPFAQAPLLDARMFSEDAGRVADGRLLFDTPFMLPPLYAYALGLVRAIGGGLVAVGIAQLVLHLATIVLLARVAAMRFGGQAGVLAAAAYALLLEPGYHTARVTGVSLRLLLIVLFWWALIRAQADPRRRRWWLAGALCGLNALASPALLLTVPAVVVWRALAGQGVWRGLQQAACFAAACAVLIAPAVAHNAAVDHELIPVTADGGLAFARGNTADGVGLRAALPGIADDRRQQHQDARRLTEQALHRPATWSDVSGHLYRQALAVLGSNPAHAATLQVRKAWLFLTARRSSDGYEPLLEWRDGLTYAALFTPAPAAWVVIPGLLGLGLCWRRRAALAPELILIAALLVVVQVYYYTPADRTAALPMLVACAAGGVVQAVRAGVFGRQALAFALALSLAIASGGLNRLLCIDRIEDAEPRYRLLLSSAYDGVDRFDDARRELERVLANSPDDADAISALGRLLYRCDRVAEALPLLERCAAGRPDDARAQHRLALALDKLGRRDEALEAYKRAAALAPREFELRYNYGAALLRADRLREALAETNAAALINPMHAWTQVNLARIRLALNELDTAAGHARRAIMLDPALPQAYLAGAMVLAQAGDFEAAAAMAAMGLERTPVDSPVRPALEDYRSRRVTTRPASP